MIPGGIALLSDTIGFITIMLIKIRMIQEMAITASIGVAVIILTDLILVPVLLSYVKLDQAYQQKLVDRAEKMAPLWSTLGKVTTRKTAAAIVAVAAVLFAVGGWKATQIKIGDLHAGVPELRATSQYNMDTDVITKHFSLGVDTITTIIESHPEACTEHDIMSVIDDFEWHIKNVQGVQSVFGIGAVSKIINAGWNEGSLMWRELPRNTSTMAQAVTYIDTSPVCSTATAASCRSTSTPRTTRRRPSTGSSTRSRNSAPSTASEDLKFRLATGNVGVMAATNEAVSAGPVPDVDVGLRRHHPALPDHLPIDPRNPLHRHSAGPGVDPRLRLMAIPRDRPQDFDPARGGPGCRGRRGLRHLHLQQVPEPYSRGRVDPRRLPHDPQAHRSGVIFTGITLAVGVATWIFAPIKFQADMGILLTFMFLLNMAGAIVLLPALAYWLKPKG